MLTIDKYNQILNNIKPYTNQEYLELQVWFFKNAFYTEAAAIKDTSLRFVAFSNAFGEAFNLNYSCLGKRLKDVININQSVCEKIEENEKKIIEKQKSQDSIFHVNVDKQHFSYLVRKRPLINPATSKTVGLIDFSIKFDVIKVRRLLTKNSKYKAYSNVTMNQEYFSEQQQQIITCLLLGFHKRKEIADILEKITNNEVSENQVKYLLNTLYDKYKCDSTGDLIDLISINENLAHNVTGVVLPDNMYTIE